MLQLWCFTRPACGGPCVQCRSLTSPLRVETTLVMSPFCHVSKSPVVLRGSAEQLPLSGRTGLLFPLNWFQQCSTVCHTVGNDLNTLRASSLLLSHTTLCFSFPASLLLQQGWTGGGIENRVLLCPESLQFSSQSNSWLKVQDASLGCWWSSGPHGFL